MLRIVQSNSASRAQSYFSASDYYSEGQELVGQWGGKGADRLGLSGVIAKRDWDRLCDNMHPASGEPLTVRKRSERRVGYDFNLHAPKSVSLLLGTTQDDRIVHAFREAVRDAMNEIEADAKCRVRQDGKNEDRLTENLTWGEYVHLTSRPVGGVPDPHLHAHCFVFNATFDPEESRWKAAQLGDIKRDAPYFEAVFHSALARRLEELGLRTERTATGWELEGFSKATLDKFSQRTKQIEAVAKEKGIVNPEAKAELGASTRERKLKGITMRELRDAWTDRLTPDERVTIGALSGRIGSGRIAEDIQAAHSAVSRAMEHCFERASVVPERTLTAEAIKQGVGKASPAMMKQLVQDEQLIHASRSGRRYVTTREVLAEESRMLAFARDGRGVCRPIQPIPRKFRRDWLNRQQMAAVRHVLESRDRVILIRGAAGTGKTTMMQEARDAIEEAGVPIFAFAPSAAASRGVLRQEGFQSAETVARLLADPTLQEEIEGGVVWIDEAGLIGTKTMSALFALAQRKNARLVLAGDVRQHGSIERGAALRLLEDEAGLKPAEIKEIQRQKAQYKAAVADLSDGRTEEGFRRLDKLGWIREVPDENRYGAIAAAYLDALRAGKTALVVSPTHVEGEHITEEIRRRMRAEQLLGNESRELTRLIPANLTLGQRKDATNYGPGDVVLFQQNARGHRKGQILTVGRDSVPLDQAERFGVFRKGTLAVSSGDRIRITKSGLTRDGHRLNNGDAFTVKAFAQDGDLLLSNGWVLPADYGHITHGLVTTSHASQSRTVDQVIVGQSSQSFRASSREQFYVSLSRGREQALVFTDNKAELMNAVSHSDERLNATEMVAGTNPKRSRVIRPVPIRQPEASSPSAARVADVEMSHER